jgi:hypothetical protein
MELIVARLSNDRVDYNYVSRFEPCCDDFTESVALVGFGSREHFDPGVARQHL